MKWTACIMFLMVTVFPALLGAEFYRYEDEQGNVHYTDDLSSVPADKRQKVHEYDESQIRSVVKEQETVKKQQVETSEALSPEKAEGSTERPSLREQGAALDAEYRALMQEREQLMQAEQQSATPATRAKLQEKIVDFNERMKDYEKRKDAFNQKVEAHNTSLKKDASSADAKKE